MAHISWVVVHTKHATVAHISWVVVHTKHATVVTRLRSNQAMFKTFSNMPVQKDNSTQSRKLIGQSHWSLQHSKQAPKIQLGEPDYLLTGGLQSQGKRLG